MEQVKLMVKGGLYTLVACVVITLTILVMSELGQFTLAQTIAQPGVTVQEEVQYLSLEDASLQRDITVQRFSPLEVTE
jgi:hypothetical protein